MNTILSCALLIACLVIFISSPPLVYFGLLIYWPMFFISVWTVIGKLLVRSCCNRKMESQKHTTTQATDKINLRHTAKQHWISSVLFILTTYFFQWRSYCRMIVLLETINLSYLLDFLMKNVKRVCCITIFSFPCCFAKCIYFWYV